MFNLTNKQLNGRMASALIFLSKEIYESNKFKLTLSRRDLADFTSMSTMGAIRVINSIKTDKIIIDEKGVLEILNFDAMRLLPRLVNNIIIDNLEG